MNCIFKVYAGFCLLLKNCKCVKNKIKNCNGVNFLFLYLLLFPKGSFPNAINVMASVLVSVAPAFQYVFLTQRYVHSAGRWF